MSDVITFVKDHWAEIGTAVALIIIAGERIAAITENKTDDAIFSGIHKVLSAIGLKFPETK